MNTQPIENARKLLASLASELVGPASLACKDASRELARWLEERQRPVTSDGTTEGQYGDVT